MTRFMTLAMFALGLAAPANAAWWSGLDPALGALIERAHENNLDVRAARSQVTATAAGRDVQSSALYPSLSFDVGANVTPTESLGFQFGGIPSAPGVEKPDTTTSGSAMLNARLQTDLGRTFFGRLAGDRDVDAADATVDQLRELVALQVAQAFYDLASAREQVKLLEEQRASTEELVKAIELRFERGDATAIDLLNQRGQLASFESQIPSVRAQVTTARLRLRAIVGEEIDESTFAAAKLPTFEGPLAVEAAFEDRPDIRVAQARLEAAEQRRMSAWFGLLPTLGVSANAGSQFFISDETREQFVWGLGATVSVPLFQGFGRSSQVRQASAAESANRAQLSAVMRDRRRQLAEAEAIEVALLEQVEKTAAQVETAKMSFEEARSRYLEGLVDSTQLLVSQSTYFAAERGLLLSRRAHADARLRLLESAGVSMNKDSDS
jgi:multidrug efflux system outer membrane protein